MSRSTTTGLGPYQTLNREDHDSDDEHSSITSSSSDYPPGVARAASIFSPWRREPQQHQYCYWSAEDQTSTSGLDWDGFLRDGEDDDDVLHSPSSGDEAPDIPPRPLGSSGGNSGSTLHTRSNSSNNNNEDVFVSASRPAEVRVGATLSSSYSFSDDGEIDEEEGGSATERIRLLDHAYQQFERMVEQQRYDPSPPPNEMDDDHLSHELQELEQSEFSLRQELQKFS